MAARTPVALTIAGSDSGGGAGIQADLKAFAALGVHGVVAITALTAQNTQRVVGIYETPAELLAAQLAAVAPDFQIEATKVGLLPSRASVLLVARKIRE